MTPHLGQKLTLFLKQTDTGVYQDTIVVAQVPGAIFDVASFKIKPGLSYNIDFYADHNMNGVYNSPPADHAWRIPLNNVLGDTLVNFAHNTNFTDIFNVTSSQIFVDNSDNIRLYPNPASQFIQLMVPRNYVAIQSVKVYSITGTMIDQKAFPGSAEYFRYDISQFKKGVYFMEINAGSRKDVLKFIKQ